MKPDHPGYLGRYLDLLVVQLYTYSSVQGWPQAAVSRENGVSTFTWNRYWNLQQYPLMLIVVGIVDVNNDSNCH